MEDPFHMQFKVLSEKIARFLPGVVVQPLGGRWAASNRGLIHFSDIFKPNTGHYQLLSASEEHRVTINGISVNVDTLIGGTCNVEDYESLKKNPLSGGLRDRIRRFGVNYVLNFKDEEKIYLRDLSGVKKKHIAPHSVSLAALGAVLTRLDKPIEEGLPENIALSEKAKQLLLGVNPMQKAEIYAGKERHEFEYFGEDEVKLIDDNFRKALKYTEGLLEQAYNYSEGTFGISPRKIQDLFKKILKKGQCLDPVTVLEGIEKLILEEKSDHDFLAWEEALKSEFSNNEGVLAMFTSDSLDVGSYFNSHKALVWVKNYYEEKIRHEVCFALLDLKPERLDRLIRDYIENVELAVINPDSHGESNSKDRADFGLLEEIETKLGYDQGTDDLEKYRREVIARFHEYVKQFPPAETGGINYRKALPDLYEDLYHALFAEKSDAMDFENLQEAVYRYNTESFGDMEMCVRKEAERVIDRMKEFYGYCDVCAKKTLLYAFKSIEDIFF
ncbi:MAG: hypothetical protein DRP29_06275 [Thermodesulfobacteriota bacterium]|nr:MAG: hypothetical protein DRP29_06275 [Thermodesulfobacteriota bacterium]